MALLELTLLEPITILRSKKAMVGILVQAHTDKLTVSTEWHVPQADGTVRGEWVPVSDVVVAKWLARPEFVTLLNEMRQEILDDLAPAEPPVETPVPPLPEG